VTKPKQKVASQEPIGIVISRGERDEPRPVLWAYIWGPAPEVEVGRAEPKAKAVA
jgi:hypothetical protein